MCSCSVNLSELSEGEVHDLMLNVFAKGGGDPDGGGGEVLGTIQCLLQISSTNVEEESERNPVDMQLVSKRYVSFMLKTQQRVPCEVCVLGKEYQTVYSYQ